MRALPGLDLSKGMPRDLFKETINNRTWVRNQNSHLQELLIYEYTDWSNASDPIVLRQRFIDINTDATFKAPAILSAKAFVKKQFPTYFYQLETAPATIPGYQKPHGQEYITALIFFTHLNLTTAGEIKLSKDIMTLWTNFAKTGNPNKPTPLEKNWPQYTADHEEYLGLSPNLTVRSKMRPDKMALWNELLPSIQETMKPTRASHMPTTTGKTDDKKDKLVMVLAILTGVFGALAVILLVLLITTCCKRKRRERDYLEYQLT
ncbi:hypothetical protein OS493_017221 [Desmophyllum pertusum]|uniref:Carboxylesterase type B domain-containing protein n=1 Tax=Desmophyllum pertusum TaxID=174260 RepID=A0A9W9YE49_9CNID|nr:hypothetical protein OS493_017221 [Desmophyllum pertusum]